MFPQFLCNSSLLRVVQQRKVPRESQPIGNPGLSKNEFRFPTEVSLTITSVEKGKKPLSCSMLMARAFDIGRGLFKQSSRGFESFCGHLAVTMAIPLA